MSVAVDEAPPDVTEDRRPGRWDRLGQALFPPAERRPVTWRSAALAAGAVLAGTAVGLTRTRGQGTLRTIWAEDGSILLTDALGKSPWHAVTSPLNGYFIVVPRLLAEVTAWAPVSLAAKILSTEAAVMAAAMALLVFVASRAHLPDPALRLLITVPMVVTPVGALFTPHVLVTLQFLMLVVTFWILLWVPATRAGRILGPVVLVLVGLSSVLIIAFLPLAVLRVALRRDRHSAALLTGLVSGFLVQLGGLLFGPATRAGISHPHPDPFWALAEYAVWGLPYSVLGQHWMEPQINDQNGYWPVPGVHHTGEHAFLILAAWAVVLGAVMLAARGITRPHWVLAAVAGAYSVGVLALEMTAMGYVSDTYLVPEESLVITDRYLIPAYLLLLTAMVAMLRPDGRLGRHLAAWPANAWPILAFTMLVVVVCVANFRHDNPRSKSRNWSTAVAEATAECRSGGQREVEVAVGARNWGHAWPQIRIPCAKLTG
jgi:hypothetical protein